MRPLNIVGTLLIIAALVLSWIWFDWKLSLIIFLALMGNNLERSGRDEQDPMTRILGK